MQITVASLIFSTLDVGVLEKKTTKLKKCNSLGDLAAFGEIICTWAHRMGRN